MKNKSALLSLATVLLQRNHLVEGFNLHQRRVRVTKTITAIRCRRQVAVVTTALAAVPPTPSTSSERKDISNPIPSAGAGPLSSSTSISTEEIQQTILREAKEAWECLQVAAEPFLLPTKQQGSSSEGASGITNAVVQLCDKIDSLVQAQATWQAEKDDDSSRRPLLWVNQQLQMRRRAYEFARYHFLCQLMKEYYDAYVATATFLSPSRIPREQLPNVQDVPVAATSQLNRPMTTPSQRVSANDDENALVPDCELAAVAYQDTPLDQLLLRIFRKLVETNTGGIASDKPGIEGLLDQGRTFMLLPGQTSEAQHEMVRKTLGGLMTPVLPPFYRIFMAGIVPPKLGTKWDGQQLGPWFYAPWLTSVVTPPFFQFLVGPSTPNRRKDGQLGGLLVQKCKFLQESNCKGLCLHQCKLPAQQFFMDELGVPLTVSPNFVTQECQWSFGEVPLEPADDPSFPAGCLAGCESRRQVSEMISSRSPNGVKASLCSY